MYQWSKKKASDLDEEDTRFPALNNRFNRPKVVRRADADRDFSITFGAYDPSTRQYALILGNKSHISTLTEAEIEDLKKFETQSVSKEDPALSLWMTNTLRMVSAMPLFGEDTDGFQLQRRKRMVEAFRGAPNGYPSGDCSIIVSMDAPYKSSNQLIYEQEESSSGLQQLPSKLPFIEKFRNIQEGYQRHLTNRHDDPQAIQSSPSDRLHQLITRCSSALQNELKLNMSFMIDQVVSKWSREHEAGLEGWSQERYTLNQRAFPSQIAQIKFENTPTIDSQSLALFEESRGAEHLKGDSMVKSINTAEELSLAIPINKQNQDLFMSAWCTLSSDNKEMVVVNQRPTSLYHERTSDHYIITR